jgi:hypothetical protein
VDLEVVVWWEESYGVVEVFVVKDGVGDGIQSASGSTRLCDCNRILVDVYSSMYRVSHTLYRTAVFNVRIRVRRWAIRHRLSSHEPPLRLLGDYWGLL